MATKGSGGGKDGGAQAQEQQKAEQAEAMRKDILEKMMTLDAAERLARIKLTKPDKVRDRATGP